MTQAILMRKHQKRLDSHSMTGGDESEIHNARKKFEMILEKDVKYKTETLQQSETGADYTMDDEDSKSKEEGDSSQQTFDKEREVLISTLTKQSGFYLDTSVQSEGNPPIIFLEGAPLQARFVKLGFYNKIFVGRCPTASNGSLYFDWEADRCRIYTLIILARNYKFLVLLNLEETFSEGDGLYNSSLVSAGVRKSFKFTISLILDYYKSYAKMEEMRALIKDGLKRKDGATIKLKIKSTELQKEADENDLASLGDEEDEVASIFTNPDTPHKEYKGNTP